MPKFGEAAPLGQKTDNHKRRPERDPLGAGDVESIARGLDPHARRTGGDGWSLRCPAHADGNASLSLGLGDKGDLLAKCHAGCDFESVLGAIRERGLLPEAEGEATPKRRAKAALVARVEPKPKRPTRNDGPPIHYDYTDESGELLFQVVRQNTVYTDAEGGRDKTFKQRRPNGKGGWIDRLGDVRRVPYRLPQIVAAEGVVFLVEGERDADNLAGLGFAASTNAGGARNWTDDLAAPLAGKDVVVIPDNDPVGREAAVARAESAVKAGAASVRLLEPFDVPGKGKGADVSDWLEAGDGTADALRELVDGTDLYMPAAFAATWDDDNPAPAAGKAPKLIDGALRPDGREVVMWSEERAEEVYDRAAAMLAEEVYLRGPLPRVLVRVDDAAASAGGDDDRDTVELGGVRHPRGMLMLAEPSPERLQSRLNRLAVLYTFDKREEEWVPKEMSARIATRLVRTACDRSFKPCSGIVNGPLYRNGRVVAAKGYDAASKAIIDFDGELPPVPERPTRADAEAAFSRLLRPFRGYIDGRSEEDAVRLRCAIGAAVLSAALRPSLGTCPAFLIDANQPGSGKGLLARALAILATGRPPSVVTEGHGPEELEKRLSTALLSGASCLLLDNLRSHLASPTLESMLTEGTATIRVFGTTDSVTVPANALVLLTSNNASTSTDFLRRSVPVRIVTEMDEPERRSFGFDPAEEVATARLALLADAFTVARAWGQAEGREEEAIRKVTLGSFARWSDLVGGAVAWLTGMHPADIVSERKAADPVKNAKAQLFEEIRRAFGFDMFQAKDAAEKIDPEAWRSLKGFFGDAPTATFAGQRFREMKDQVLNGFKLESELDRKGVALWYLRQVREDVNARVENPLTNNNSVRGVPGTAGDHNTSRGKVADGSEGGEGESVVAIFPGAGGPIPGDPRHPRQAMRGSVGGHSTLAGNAAPEHRTWGKPKAQACVHCGGNCPASDTGNSIRREDGTWEHLACALRAEAVPAE